MLYDFITLQTGYFWLLCSHLNQINMTCEHTYLRVGPWSSVEEISQTVKELSKRRHRATVLSSCSGEGLLVFVVLQHNVPVRFVSPCPCTGLSVFVVRRWTSVVLSINLSCAFCCATVTASDLGEGEESFRLSQNNLNRPLFKWSQRGNTKPNGSSTYKWIQVKS